MTWWKASIATATSQAIRIVGGLITIKLIAVYLGPEGLGKLGHFMSLIAILTVLAGGGILNGIVKYVAEYKDSPKNLYNFLSNALFYSLTFSLFVFIGLTISAKYISLLLFGSERFTTIIIFLAATQVIYGLVTYCNGIINGLRKTTSYAKIIIIGTSISIPISYVLISLYKFNGAIISLAIVNVCLLLPALLEIKKLDLINHIKLATNKKDTINLSRFSIMQVFSLITLPLAEIYIRNLIIEGSDWYEAGIWQSLMRLSSVYTGFFLTFLAVYYLPTLSNLSKKEAQINCVLEYIKVIGISFLLAAIAIYILKDLIIAIAFTKEFSIQAHQLAFQLLGDLFKILAYIIGFLLVAKAKTTLYILGELAQTILYINITIYFIKLGSTNNVYPAYALSNFIYFLVCISGFWYWFQKKPPTIINHYHN